MYRKILSGWKAKPVRAHNEQYRLYRSADRQWKFVFKLVQLDGEVSCLVRSEVEI